LTAEGLFDSLAVIPEDMCTDGEHSLLRRGALAVLRGLDGVNGPNIVCLKKPLVMRSQFPVALFGKRLEG